MNNFQKEIGETVALDNGDHLYVRIREQLIVRYTANPEEKSILGNSSSVFAKRNA